MTDPKPAPERHAAAHAAPEPVDTLLSPQWVIPIEPADRVLERHSIAIRDGRIVDLLPTEAARARHGSQVEVSLPGCVVAPGLVNCHTHAAMALMRGLADDLALHEWLSDYIWPVESHCVNEAFVHDGTRLACAEMLRGGVTCFNDMYFYPDAAARAAQSCGMRVCVGLICIDFPTVWAGNPDEYISKGLEVHDQFRGCSTVHTAFAPHAPYTVSDGPLQRLAVLAEELDIPLHMHVHETRTEVERAVAEHGRRPIARLDTLGLVGPRLMAVHATALEASEIELFAERGVHVVHCPESNLKLASGICPVHTLVGAGVNIAIGTDGSASNNDLDMLGETRTAALLASGSSGVAGALNAHKALECATLGGARALGLEHRIGSIVPGKSADLFAVDMSGLETQPLFDVYSQLLYAASRAQVSDVWVEGRRVLTNRQLSLVDTAELGARVRQWQTRVAAAVPTRAAHSVEDTSTREPGR
ncbi:MAG: TRZ/ATZ family hydrolase [Gammaproteobacteria bacterium]|nr:TRZ/ATZ family hydrolase [Gammaproteobacteria bacterium]